MRYILTQDVGMFSCKANLFSLDGAVVRSTTIFYEPQHSKEGVASQSPYLWWDAFCKNCHSLLDGLNADDVIAVSLCGQSMGCLPVDNKGEPLYNNIVWRDAHSVKQVQQLSGSIGSKRIYQITGTHHSSMFSLSKIMWLKQTYPEIYQHTYKFIQCKDFINFKLCGQLLTDETDAGFMQLYDLFDNKWSDEILTAADIAADKLPEVVHMGTVLGHVTSEAAESSGLSRKTLVIEGLCDGRATVLGSAALLAGDGCIYLGASSWVSQITDQTNMDPQCTISKCSYYRPDLYANGATMLAGRFSIDWYIKEFFADKYFEYPDLQAGLYRFVDEQVVHSPVGSKALLFLPYLSGERAPWWNATAKGGFVGLCSNHTKYDFCRSILEGVAFNLGLIKDNITKMGPLNNMHMVGAANSHQWQQILSDVFEMDITSSCVTDNVGCVGAAIVAGVATGVFDDYRDVKKFHRHQRITTPLEKNVEIYRELLPTFEDCYYALRDINQHLDDIRSTAQ